MNKLIVFTLACVAGLAGHAQTGGSRDTGQPFVTHYLPNTYGGSTQVFSISQDSRGVLYFGLGSGLIEFDGVSTRGIPTPGNTIVRTMTTDPTKRVYVGTVDDFGYLAPNAAGEMKYVSLIEFVPKEERGFQDVYSMRWTPAGLFIQAPERLIRLIPEEEPTAEHAPRKWRVKVWRPTSRLGGLSYAFGSVYLLQLGKGLLWVTGDSLELAPGGAEFSADRAVRVEEFSGKSMSDGQALVFRRGRGFSLLSRGVLKPFPTEADGLIDRLGVSQLSILRDGTLGLALSTGGFLNLDREGHVIVYLDRASGSLPSDGALSVFTGRDGVVWLGMQKGMAKIETPSAFSRFGESAGLSGFVNDMVRHRGVLYAATMQGIFYLDAKTGRFERVPGMPKAAATSVFSLLPVGDRLLAPGFASGIYEVTVSAMKQVAPRPENSGVMFVMYQSPSDPSLIYVGCDNMLTSYRLAPSGRITFERKIADTPAIRSIVESASGTVWLGLESQGVMRVRTKGEQVDVKQFGTADGLAGEVVALVAGEEQGEQRVLARGAEPARGHLALERGLEGLARGQLRRVVVRVLDVVLRDEIDLHVVAGHFHADRLHVTDLRGARRGIGGQRLHALEGRGAAIHHHFAGASRNHLRQHRARQAVQGMHHEIEGRGEVFIAKFAGGDAGEGRARQVGDEDIDPAAVRDQRVAGAGGAQVALVGDDLGAFLAKDLDRGRAHVVLALGDEYAFAEQALAHGVGSKNPKSGYCGSDFSLTPHSLRECPTEVGPTATYPTLGALHRAARSAWRKVSTMMPSSSSLAVAAGPRARMSPV